MSAIATARTCAACLTLSSVMPRRSRVRIFTQGVRVSFGEYLHQPAVKVIHRMVHDRFETAVVLSMCFVNVIFQSDANVAVFAAQANLLGPQHLNILH